MASNLALVSGSPFIGNPIVYQVTGNNLAGSPVFHRIRLKVTCALTTDTDWTDIIMSSPVGNGETIRIDISSALRTVADKYVYTPNPPEEYPYIKYYLSAWDEYLLNGQEYSGESTPTTNGSEQNPSCALMGAYSDLERLLSNGSKLAYKFTRKPNTVEIVQVGEEYVSPLSIEPATIAEITNGQTSATYEIAYDGMQKINGHRLYALDKDQTDRYQLRFVNGLGCLESINVQSLMKQEVQIETEQFTSAKQEMFNEISRGFAVKMNDFNKYKMSSGAVDRAWQEWFLHEFLMAEQVWIKINGTWIPCHVLPDETVQGIDMISKAPLDVQFTLQLDICGSPLSALAI